MKNISIIRISLSFFILFSWLLPAVNAHGEEQLESSTTEEPGLLMGLLDSSHAFMLERANGPAVWFDSFFGDPRIEEEEEPPTTTLRLRLASRLVEGEGFTFPIRLRASFFLPKANRKLRLIVIGEGKDEFTTIENEESTTTTTTTGSDETEEKSRVGLRYSIYKTLRSKLHLGGGLRLSSPFEYYARIRYRRIIHIGRQNIVRFSETGYWNSIDGYGETSLLDLDRLLTKTVTARLSLSGTYSEISRGLAWGVGTSLLKQFSTKTAASLDLGAYGVTRPDTEVLTYRIGCRLRKNILRPWLFLEIVPEVTFPLDELTRERDTVGAILLMLDYQFTAK